MFSTTPPVWNGGSQSTTSRVSYWNPPCYKGLGIMDRINFWQYMSSGKDSSLVKKIVSPMSMDGMSVRDRIDIAAWIKVTVSHIQGDRSAVVNASLPFIKGNRDAQTDFALDLLRKQKAMSKEEIEQSIQECLTFLEIHSHTSAIHVLKGAANGTDWGPFLGTSFQIVTTKRSGDEIMASIWSFIKHLSDEVVDILPFLKEGDSYGV
jgi:hypothetical protein